MFLSEEVQHLLDTKMDRKEFLAYLGAALLTVLGVSGFLRALTNPTLLRQARPGRATSANGFGGGAYGGRQ